jgi:pseudouridine-5'-phosphate glycosidase
VPAVTAVLDGVPRVGLDVSEHERILGQARKVAERDVPVAVAQRWAFGATTVSAAVALAHLAGIRVFATGGIGGVHRGAETSFDISADLQELSRTPVAVVCAGAKSILDLRLTLEYLETHGVPVLGYRTHRLPAFFTPDSGLDLDARLDEPADIARVMKAQWELGFHGGLVVANPIPAEHALPAETVDRAIEQALADARLQGLGGKAVTPFLLARVNALTGGVSLAGNIQLVLNNARLAAAVAVAYAAL